MEHALPFRTPNFDWKELKLSKDISFNTDRSSTNVKSFKTIQDDEPFDEADADLIDVDPDDPFESVFDDINKKKQKYPGYGATDGSVTDTNMDSTDTEPTDTDMTTSTSAQSIFTTTTDEDEKTESLNPNTEALSSPTYHPSEDDSDQSTDSEYFDSDAPTDSSDHSYTSLSENIDDSRDPSSPSDDEMTDSIPPAKGGPPRTVKWSEDEVMEVPVHKSKAKNIFDPFKEKREEGKKKFAHIIGREDIVKNCGVSNIFSSIAKHIAPNNSVNFLPDPAEERLTSRRTNFTGMSRNSFLN
ncbi:dentin sialophosphoprotein-like [Macrosteles quadrilineatus]|uniref:dentin sialophosphoprotein-like n=1 Tax=Macrosteles quadrilineatus TaxID=74068 RepID=UPI0023E2B860|nr:dentin sialophosphoprotein-like [Macrosteles quadrilineatus]